jgi:hypothetical protein
MEAEATFPTPAAARGELAKLGEHIEGLCKENDGRFEIEQNLQSLDLVSIRCLTQDARDYRIEAKMDGAASVKILGHDANKPESIAERLGIGNYPPPPRRPGEVISFPQKNSPLDISGQGG